MKICVKICKVMSLLSVLLITGIFQSIQAGKKSGELIANINKILKENQYSLHDITFFGKWSPLMEEVNQYVLEKNLGKEGVLIDNWNFAKEKNEELQGISAVFASDFNRLDRGGRITPENEKYQGILMNLQVGVLKQKAMLHEKQFYQTYKKNVQAVLINVFNGMNDIIKSMQGYLREEYAYGDNKG